MRVCSECFSRLHHHTSPCQCNNNAAARNTIKNQEIESTDIPSQSNTDLSSLACPRLKIISVSKEGCAEASLQANQQKSQPSTVTSQAVN